MPFVYVFLGTFSVAPTIFFQFFALMSSVSQDDNVFTLPFVYVLLDYKQECSYTPVFETVFETIIAKV